MKKILAVAAAMATLATAAFADVNVGGFGRHVFSTVGNDGDETTTFQGVSWGDNARTGMSIDWSSDTIGAHLDFNADAWNYGINDMTYMWIKPIDMLTITSGIIQDDTNRINACLPAWDLFRYSSMAGNFEEEGMITSRLINGRGVKANLKPIDGLDVVVAVPLPNAADYKKSEDVYKATAAGVGYSIDGIGKIVAQFIGDAGENKKGDKNVGKFEVGFDLSAVENLTFAVGAKFALNEEADDRINFIAAKAGYNFGVASVNANLGVEMGGKDAKDDDLDPRIGFGIGGTYNIEGGMFIDADCHVFMPQNDVDPSVGFAVAFGKGFSNGHLKIAFEGVNVGEGAEGGFTAGRLVKDDGKDSKDGGFIWMIPVVMTYYF